MMTMLAACDVGHSGVKGYMDGQEARAAWKKGIRPKKQKIPGSCWFNNCETTTLVKTQKNGVVIIIA